MVVNEEIEKIRLFKYKWGAPKYYDYPDGEDLLGKLSFTTKAAFFGGSMLGLLDAYAKKPVAFGHKQRLIRVFGKIIPSVGMAVAFTVGTYYATKIRKKDDEINYVLGSIAAGAVLTAYAGGNFGFFGTLIMSAMAAVQKNAQMKGKTLIPNEVRKTAGPYDARTFKLFPLPKEEIKGNWTKALPPQQ